LAADGTIAANGMIAANGISSARDEHAIAAGVRLVSR
jgi:hypothetical protein